MTTDGRRAYLAKLTDAELHAQLGQNERTLQYGTDIAELEELRAELLEEMRRRPNYGPRKA